MADRRRRFRKRASARPWPCPRGPTSAGADFVTDALSWGRRFRILAVVDDFTREALAFVVDTSIGGGLLVRELDALVAPRGKPAAIVSDTGPR